MSSNYPANNEIASSSRPGLETSFTQNISTRMKNFFKITKWFRNSTMTNSNGMALERSAEDDPERPPNKKIKFNHPGTSDNYTSLIETRNASTNTDSAENSPVQSGMVRPPTPSTYSDNKEEKLNYNHNFSLSNNNNSVTRKRKSLSASRSEDNAAHGSTFYTGETVYGGASTSYINSPNIKHTKNTNIYNNKVNHNTTLSHSTRRICDLLENYSSPLIEAKRISQCTIKSTNINNSVDNTNSISFAGKTQKLHSPCLANILKFKQKSRLMDTTRAARQLIASQSSSAPYILPNKKSSNNQEKKSEEVFITKIKTKLTRSDHGLLDKETQPPLDLPTNALQIDMNNLPTFSQLSTQISENEKKRVPEKIELFKFSSPEKKENNSIRITISPPKWSGNLDNNEILEKGKNNLSSPKLMMSNNGNNQKSASDAEPNTEPIPMISAADVPKPIPIIVDLDKWRCPTCMIKNDNLIESCVCCGEKKPKSTESSNTTVVSSSITKPNIGFSHQNKSNTPSTLSTTLIDSQNDKWECPGCYVRNEKKVNKCVCCETNKPGFSGITQNKGFNFGETNKITFKFGISPMDYTTLEEPTIEVPICNRDNNLSKTNKAGTHSKFTFVSTATPVGSVEPVFVPAPVATAVPAAPLAAVASVAAAAPVATAVPAAPLAAVASVAAAAPVATETPVATEAPVTAAEPISAATPVAAAVLDAAAALVTATAPLFHVASVFNTTSLPSAADVGTGINKNEKQTAILPESSQKVESNAKEPSNILLSSLSPMQPAMISTFNNNRDTSNNELQIASTSIQALKPFSFSAPPQGTQPVNLFSPPPSSSSPFSNTQVSASSLVSPASNVSQISFAPNPVTTSVSFFQSNNLISNPAPSTSSLFKISETSTIGECNAVVPNPPIFTFGHNVQNLQPQSENFKFNFTFKPKNLEAPSMFNTQLFGSQASNNIENNKTFNLTSGNVMSSNTDMMNNILPGNGLSTGNPMESNRGNAVVPMGDATTSNHMGDGNNMLGGNSSHSMATGFHTQMNRDVWPTSNTGANSFSFTSNTRFNSSNSAPTCPRFENPGPSTAFNLPPQMPVGLQPQNMFGSQSHVNSGSIFGAPGPSTLSPPAPSFERSFGNTVTNFNFGVGAQNSGFFGQTQAQQNQPMVYSFGGQSNGITSVPVQFNMGTSPGTPARRVRKAIRRTTQR